MNGCTKTTPVPVRFEAEEEEFLQRAKQATGVPVVELVRRSVRLLHRQQQLMRSYAFILELHERR